MISSISCHIGSNQQVSAVGKAILITGCESPLAWCLARKLDDLGFTVFAGFTKRTGCNDADLLKEESSGRTKILQLDVTSETQVRNERGSPGWVRWLITVSACFT